MRNLKYFSLLRTLQGTEIEGFHRFLKRRYKATALLVRVNALYKGYLPVGPEDDFPDLDSVARKVFGREKSELKEPPRKKLLNLLHDLHVELKDFLIHETTRSGSWHKLIWLDILKERNQDRAYSLLALEMNHVPDSPKRVDEKRLIQSIQEQLHYARYLVEFAPGNSSVELGFVLADLKLYMSAIQAKYSCAMLNQQKLAANAPGVVPLKSSDFREQVGLFLHLYKDVRRLLKTDDATQFQLVTEQLRGTREHLTEAEILIILRYLQHFIAQQVRKGLGVNVLIQQNELNKMCLEHGFFTQKTNNMSSIQFNNIVTAAVTANDFEWAQEFITVYSSKLSPVLQEDTVLIAHAIVLFNQRNFRGIIRIIENHHFKIGLDRIRARTLLLRCYIEVKMHPEKILALCNTFEQELLRMKKIKQEIRQANLLFNRIIFMMAEGILSRKEVLEAVNTTEPIYFKSWLLEKANEY